MNNKQHILDEWTSFIDKREFPCVAAKASMSKEQQSVFVAGHIACPKDDADILSFIYDFVDKYRSSDKMFHSAIVIFEQPIIHNEQVFEQFFWQRLQAISALDSMNYPYDERVSSDPGSENFSFSLKSEAFFVVGLNPASSRMARRFTHPAIVFNPHAQFEQLRSSEQYEKLKNIIRKRDTELQGFINPMLEDFGSSSEAFQYSGRQLDESWKCPLNIYHGNDQHYKSA
jgi:uncharacterized protein